MKDNKIKLFTELLIIVAIVLISFVGIYKQKENRMENQVKEFQYSTDLEGYREVLLEVPSEEENSAKDKTENDENNDENSESKENKIEESQNNYDNYLTAKKIIEERIKLLGVHNYMISQNTENGSIYLQLPDNSETDHLLSNLLQIGKLEIKDSEDDTKIYLNNENIKNVSTVYNNTTEGTTVFLNIEFDKNGKKILKELSTGEYKTNSNINTNDTENTENTQNENVIEAEVESEDSKADSSTEDNQTEEKKDTQKKIKLSIDDTELITSSFDDPIENGQINLSMNKSTKDVDSINNTLKSASTISSVLKSGIMPIKYEINRNSYIQTDINNNLINRVYIILGIIFAVALIVLIFKYNVNGIIAAINNIGFLALYLLVIRYTNVIISLESIFTAAIIVIINYLLVNDFLKMQDNSKLINIFKTQIMKTIPIILVAIIFSFINVTKISTCGMFLFWGILVSFIYNYVLTRDMIIRKEVNINGIDKK